MPRTNKTELINSLKIVFNRLNRLPTTREFDDLSGQRSKTARKYFGTWERFIELADLSGEVKRDRNIYSNDYLIKRFTELSAKLSRQPTITEFELETGHSGDMVNQRFDSWQAFVEASGFIYVDKNRLAPKVNKDAIKADVIAVSKRLKRLPRVSDYRAEGKFDSKTVVNSFGQETWQVALRLIFGLSDLQARKISQPRFRSDEERLEELRNLAARLRLTPTSELARKHGIDSLELGRRFGGWSKAVAAAGLARVSSRTRAGQFLSNVEIAAEVIRVANELRKFPTTQEFDRASKINHKTVAKRLGKGLWSNVKNKYSKLD